MKVMTLSHELRNTAYLFGSDGRWGEASLLWTLISASHNDTHSDVMRLETLRLAGILQFSGLTPRTPAEIISVLGVDYSAELISFLSREAQYCKENVLNFGVQFTKFSDALKTIPGYQVALANFALQNESDSKSLKKLVKEWGLEIVETKKLVNSKPSSHVVISDTYQMDVPGISIAYSELDTLQRAAPYEFRSLGVQVHENAQATVGSDLLKLGKEFYVDLNSWPGSKFHNTKNDSKIVSFSEKSFVIRKNSSATIDLDKACFLGYPTLDAWGHFVNEGLTRLAVFEESRFLQNVPCIVSKKVPSSFLKLAQFIFPNVDFIRLDEGVQLTVKTLYVSPYVTFPAHNIHWSHGDEDLRLNAELNSFILLKKYIHKSTSGTTGSSFSNKKVMLDRQLSNYRKSRNTDLLRQIAIDSSYLIVDPGSLGPEDQLHLFRDAVSFFGQSGSGWFLVPSNEQSANSIMVGHEQSGDWRGLAWVISKMLNFELGFVLGKRDFPIPGYSEILYHQDFHLSEQAVSRIRDLI